MADHRMPGKLRSRHIVRRGAIGRGPTITEDQTEIAPTSVPGGAAPKKKATFNLDAALHRRLKIAAAATGREMVELVEEAIEAHLCVLEKERIERP
jgi:hypothetical protein